MAAALLLLAGCGGSAGQVREESAGARLEQVAIARGVIADPATIGPTGAYASATDRVCVLPVERGYRIGAAVDYGPGQGCRATGSAEGAATLRVVLGESCRFDATVEGDRIVFPPVLPAACDRACIGRASLAALTADRLSNSASEAASLADAGGVPLCR